MMRSIAIVGCALALFGCSGPSEPPAAQKKAESPPKPVDNRRVFPAANRTAMELVESQLLGKDYMPGGNLATYEQDGTSYQLFLIQTESPDDAALLAFAIKRELSDPKFVASFGGHFGMDGETPWFLFPKAKYVAGIVGLPQDEADLVARDFASRIPNS